jgi:hypothetical protein
MEGNSFSELIGFDKAKGTERDFKMKDLGNGFTEIIRK